MGGSGDIFAARAATQKNGRQPEGASRSDFAMLNVGESGQASKAERTSFSGDSPDRKAATWLDAEVKKAARGVTTQIVELTPPLARVLLERNPGNRNIIDTIVGAYVRDIEGGDWSFNGQTVIVSSDGMLNDGQHRCTAVVMSNKPIMTVLVIGVPRETRMTLDQGRQRRAADYLSMDGYTNVSNLSSATSFYLLYANRGSLFAGGTSKPTKTEIRRFVDEHPAITESVGFVQMKGAEAYGGRSMLAFCHFVFRLKADAEAADDFIRTVVIGDNLMSRDPILYCRNRLVSERERLRPNDRAELLFRAWNARRTRQSPSKLLVMGGALPVLEG